MKSVRLPDGRIWLRVADPEWTDPLNPGYAAMFGGRWNPPASFSALYMNADVLTARAQIDRMLEGSAVRPDDLEDNAFVLVPLRLPRTQRAADAVSGKGLRALGLPPEYPLGSDGEIVAHPPCQAIGARVREAGLRGVWCRSAATPTGTGRELAWFPATSRSTARPVFEQALPYGEWRDAVSWSDLGLREQPDPRSEQ